MIRLTDPTRVGPALASIREMQGMTRRECARKIAALTGRTETSVNSQLWTWDVGKGRPELWALPAYLQVLGVDLCLDFKEEEDDGVEPD